MKRFENQLIIITGGAGCIGSCVCKYLNENSNSNVVIVDDLKQSEKWKNLVGKQFFDFIPKHELFDWMEGKQSEIDAIIHLGASSDSLAKDAGYYLDNNYKFSQKLVDYALKNDHRFIYASSFATYGKGEMGFVDDEANLEKLKPLNLYAFSKHLFDLWLKRERMLDQVVGLKFFNVFGPNEYYKGPKASMIYQMYEQVKKEGSVKLFKEGGQKRDFIYAKDVAAIICGFLTTKHVGIYNVGSGQEHSWNEIVEILSKAMETKIGIEYIDIPKELEKQYQDYTKADVTKLKGTGLLQVTPLEDAIQDYVHNYLDKELTW
ncbi:MAG: ADP-L-glycero-D-manno-heptose-6-epimerase [Chlamydiae bacterium]|nr:ADP-L-glycero-D-manno-heptose-6-epimerase [Chlamydiota bacterium]